MLKLLKNQLFQYYHILTNIETVRYLFFQDHHILQI